MTTNIYDMKSSVVATDSRWSFQYFDWLVYLDDAGFEKIERSPDHVFMFAGLGLRVQEWKTWLRSNPTGPENQPPHDGMAVCMVHIASKAVKFKAHMDITRVDALFAGTGSLPAWTCWEVNQDARRAVGTAKEHDPFTGGEVKFFNLNDGTHNLFPGADVQYSDLLKWITSRGLVMKRNGNGAVGGAPFPLKDAVASNDELRDVSAKIASGELKPCAPCDGMASEWSEHEKQEFNAALGNAFGWKK